MENQPYLSVVIPAYREAETIGHNLLEIEKFFSQKEFDCEILVITDGSPDNTPEVVRNYARQIKNLRVIENKENRGKGFVVKQGLLESKGRYAIFLDADGSTSITHVDKFFPELEKGADVVIGSRKMEGAFIQVRQPRYREILGDCANWMIRVVLGLWRYPDTQCGFKMFTQGAAHEIAKRMVVDRFGFDFEMIVLAEKLGLNVRQVPVRWLNEDESSVDIFGPNGFFQALIDLFKTKGRLITGKYDINNK